jgi:hypothetical protein
VGNSFLSVSLGPWCGGGSIAIEDIGNVERIAADGRRSPGRGHRYRQMSDLALANPPGALRKF